MIWGAVAHFVYYVLDEMKHILGIRIFHVVPKIAAKPDAQESKAKVTAS